MTTHVTRLMATTVLTASCVSISQGRERGFQSFALHPQFNQAGARGYGKFYTSTDTYTDSSNLQPKPDLLPAGGDNNPKTIGEIYASGVRNPQRVGQDAIHRILFNSGGSTTTLMQLITEKNAGATRADLRVGLGPDDRVFLLNTQDGIIREIVR